MGENKGFRKFVFDKATKEILGFHVIGPRATDLAAEVAAVMECEGTISEIGSTVHPHPHRQRGGDGGGPRLPRKQRSRTQGQKIKC